MASKITDPDMQAHIMEMLDTYEKEINQVLREKGLQIYLQNEYEKEQEELDMLLWEKRLESFDSLESEPVTKQSAEMEL